MIGKIGLALGLCLLSTTVLAGNAGSTYHISKLVSNQKGEAHNRDRQLVNSWGVVRFPVQSGAT